MNQRDWTAAPGNRPYECDPDNAVFLSTGRCPSDRTALSPAGDVSASFTNAEVPGLLEWVPWVDDDDDQSTPLKPLEPGLYNFVVVVTDADGATAQADFLVYLYDAPVHFCSGDCARARLAGPDGRGNFLPSTAGMPTFADLDGIYGRTEEEPLFNQRCAICGSGDNAGNGSVWCTPETNVGGTCAAVVASDPIVGGAGVVVGAAPPSACRRNNPPAFVSDGTVDGIVDTPGVDGWITSTTLRAYSKATIKAGS